MANEVPAGSGNSTPKSAESAESPDSGREPTNVQASSVLAPFSWEKNQGGIPLQNMSSRADPRPDDIAVIQAPEGAGPSTSGNEHAGTQQATFTSEQRLDPDHKSVSVHAGSRQATLTNEHRTKQLQTLFISQSNIPKLLRDYKVASDFHRDLREMYGNGDSYAARQLQQDPAVMEGIASYENYCHVAHAVLSQFEEKNIPNAASSQSVFKRVKSAVSNVKPIDVKNKVTELAKHPKTIAAAWTAAAVVGKTGAWYVPQLAVPLGLAKHIGIGGVTAARIFTGWAGASALEYTAAAKAGAKWQETEWSTQSYAATSGSMDNAATVATFVGTSHVTGEKVNPNAFWASVGLSVGNAVQSGAFNGIMKRAVTYIKGGTPSAIPPPISPLQPAPQAGADAAAQTAGTDLEVGGPNSLPRGKDARRQAQKLEEFLKTSPSTARLTAMQERMDGIVRVSEEMRNLDSAERFAIPPGDPRITNIGNAMESLKTSKKDLTQAAGRNWQKLAYYALPLAMTTAGEVLTYSKTVKKKFGFGHNPNRDAATLGAASTGMQNLANLLQFTLPPDAHFLKKWGIAQFALLPEFAQLQDSITKSEIGRQNAGKGAPALIFPDGTDIRLGFQEPLRSVQSGLFAWNVKGESVKPHQVIGQFINVAVGAGQLGYKYRVAKKQSLLLSASLKNASEHATVENGTAPVISVETVNSDKPKMEDRAPEREQSKRDTERQGAAAPVITVEVVSTSDSKTPNIDAVYKLINGGKETPRNPSANSLGARTEPTSLKPSKLSTLSRLALALAASSPQNYGQSRSGSQITKSKGAEAHRQR